MGYLQELQEELRGILGDFDEEKQKEIARFVGTKVLESYRNGQANGTAASRLDRAEKGLEEAGKRLFKKQPRTELPPQRSKFYKRITIRYDTRMEQENGKEKITTIEDLAAMIERTVVADLAEIKADVSSVKTTLAEMRADHLQLEDKVDAITGILANIPAKQDLEHMLEKTYHLAQLTAEHNHIKKIIQQKLGVEV